MKRSLVALVGFASAVNVKECPADEQEEADQTLLKKFKPCHVDDPSFTDYQRDGLLEQFISQWNWYLKSDKVQFLQKSVKVEQRQVASVGPLIGRRRRTADQPASCHRHRF